MVPTKEQAKENLLLLINSCISKGGIFPDANTVAIMVNSVHTLGADDTAGSGAMAVVKPSAAEQLQTRIDNNQ